MAPSVKAAEPARAKSSRISNTSRTPAKGTLASTTLTGEDEGGIAVEDTLSTLEDSDSLSSALSSPPLSPNGAVHVHAAQEPTDSVLAPITSSNSDSHDDDPVLTMAERRLTKSTLKRKTAPTSAVSAAKTAKSTATQKSSIQKTSKAGKSATPKATSTSSSSSQGPARGYPGQSVFETPFTSTIPPPYSMRFGLGNPGMPPPPPPNPPQGNWSDPEVYGSFRENQRFRGLGSESYDGEDPVEDTKKLRYEAPKYETEP